MKKIVLPLLLLVAVHGLSDNLFAKRGGGKGTGGQGAVSDARKEGREDAAKNLAPKKPNNPQYMGGYKEVQSAQDIATKDATRDLIQRTTARAESAHLKAHYMAAYNKAWAQKPAPKQVKLRDLTDSEQRYLTFDPSTKTFGHDADISNAATFTLINITPPGLAGGARYAIKISERWIAYDQGSKLLGTAIQKYDWSAPTGLAPEFEADTRKLTPAKGSTAQLLLYEEVTP